MAQQTINASIPVRRGMTPAQAVGFALEKLSNEVDREFDGADVSRREEADYKRALARLGDIRKALDLTDDGSVVVRMPMWVAIIAHEVLLEEFMAVSDGDVEAEPEFLPRHRALDQATDILAAVIPEDHPTRQQYVDEKRGNRRR